MVNSTHIELVMCWVDSKLGYVPQVAKIYAKCYVNFHWKIENKEKYTITVDS